MRKSAISVAGNIAEGAARKSKTEFLQFLNIAQGSLSELPYLSIRYSSRNQSQELRKYSNLHLD